jgi:hypothetical protein
VANALKSRGVAGHVVGADCISKRLEIDDPQRDTVPLAAALQLPHPNLIQVAIVEHDHGQRKSLANG